MQYDSVFDKWHEECGVFGIYDHTLPIAQYIYWGLFALQHRGQESAGIAVGNGTKVEVARGMGLVTEAFATLPKFKGFVGCGHVRYSTTGSNNPRNIQPLFVTCNIGDIAVAHNGNLVNAQKIREDLEELGSIFQTSMDSEVIAHLIARSHEARIQDKIKEACNQVEGAYSLTINTVDTLIGVRDPRGYRPLALGKLETGGYVLTSETCALQAIQAEFIRDIEPGEIVIIDENGVKSEWLLENQAEVKKELCVFEYIYFARPDSRIDGQSVYEARVEMGKQLARETRYEADVVIGVPDSGRAAAHGYSQESGIPFLEGLVKNRYMGRTFIKPSQEERELAVRMKLSPLPEILSGKRVVVVDDSIVRGTTSGIILKLLREAGAKEVYMCVSSPPVEYPCHYGIDTSVRKELIAANHTIEEIREYIKADKLHFLTEEGMKKAIANVPGEDVCVSCFNGCYATEVPGECEAGKKYALEQ